MSPSSPGRREGDLAFEIEMLLAADAELRAQPVRCVLERGVGIAAQEGRRRLDIGLPGKRGLDVEDRFVRLDVGLHPFGRVPRGVERCRHDHRQRLARELDTFLGEQRLAMMARRDIVLARNVAGAQHGNHTRHRRGGGKIELAQAAARHRAQHQGGMQRARRLGHVVDVERLARHMLQGAVVALGAMDRALHSASTSTARPGSAIRQ